MRLGLPRVLTLSVDFVPHHCESLRVLDQFSVFFVWRGLANLTDVRVEPAHLCRSLRHQRIPRCVILPIDCHVLSPSGRDAA
jgi:hypothetical protein